MGERLVFDGGCAPAWALTNRILEREEPISTYPFYMDPAILSYVVPGTWKQDDKLSSIYEC